MTASKNNWSNAFRSCFSRTILLYRTLWLFKLHFKAIANFSLITVGMDVRRGAKWAFDPPGN